jgi:hypothetical protein
VVKVSYIFEYVDDKWCNLSVDFTSIGIAELQVAILDAIIIHTKFLKVLEITVGPVNQ